MVELDFDLLLEVVLHRIDIGELGEGPAAVLAEVVSTLLRSLARAFKFGGEKEFSA